MESIWEKTVKGRAFPALEGKATTDVLIIGGGLAGVLCAYMLQKAGVDCMLLEAKRIGSGVSRGTTAKITIAHGLLYDSLIRRFGEDKARLYLDAQSRAIQQYRRLAVKMDFDYEEQDAFVYTLADRERVEREAAALLRLLPQNAPYAVSLSKAEGLPFAVAGALRVTGQAQCHPLKLLYGLAEGLPVYENTKAVELAPHKVKTNRGEVSYRRLIIATHFPLLNKHGGYFLKLYQHRSYVLALEGAESVGGMYVDEAKTGLSFRDGGGLLLLGGGGHRTGKQGGSYGELEAFAARYYGGAKIVGKWSAQDCMTLDGMPYIGQYAKGTPDLFVATGFNKWGMTNAMAAAEILTDLVLGKPSPYSALFSPSRSILRPQLAVNALESALGLLTPKAPRCPHLGCALHYNPAEHSWDCPCHGSRFAENGALLDNPATDDLKR
ncbi:MAG: FAD-dependent oxidoreductase [Clostridia bacterium]|nr:FAD-dependent oxidoreductase [Clostridia bacterium]